MHRGRKARFSLKPRTKLMLSHGEPTSHLPADWESIMKGFKLKHGANSPDCYLPSQSYFEAFDEKVKRQASSGDSGTGGESRGRGGTASQNSQSSCT